MMDGDCKRNGCDNPTKTLDGYCGDICKNIAIKQAAREVHGWDISDDEIETLVRKHYERINDRLEEAME